MAKLSKRAKVFKTKVDRTKVYSFDNAMALSRNARLPNSMNRSMCRFSWALIQRNRIKSFVAR